MGSEVRISCVQKLVRKRTGSTLSGGERGYRQQLPINLPTDKTADETIDKTIDKTTDKAIVKTTDIIPGLEPRSLGELNV